MIISAGNNAIENMRKKHPKNMTNVFSFFLNVLILGMLNLSQMENRPMILIGG